MRKSEKFERNSLVEKVVVHFNLRVGFEVIRHKHDGDLNMAQLIYLERRRKRRRENQLLVTCSGFGSLNGSQV